MYEQSAHVSGSRRSTRFYNVSGRRKPARGQERIRLIQLAVCLTLFLAIFLGKGIFPQRLERVQEDVQSMISADFDFRGALSRLGASLSGGDTALAELGAFCSEVFGAEAPEEKPAEPVEFQPPQPSGLLHAEREFLGQSAGTAVWAEHYVNLSELGLKLPPPVEAAADPLPAEPAVEPAAEPEEPAAVPAVGTVIASPEYSGPELPEDYTMDQLSLGELETVTPILGHLNSGFGYREHPINKIDALHGGVDIGGQTGDPIVAFAAGTVEYTGESDACGLYLQLDHGNGVKSFYAHCSRIDVSKGQAVAMGEAIAQVGSTGVSTGPHLHFELKYGKIRLNPAYYLKFVEQE